MTLSAVQYLRFIGIVFSRQTGGTSFLSPMFKMNVAAGGNHVIFDQIWAKGTVNDETARFTNPDRYSFVGFVNSFFTDFHCLVHQSTNTNNGCDAQAVSGGTNNNVGELDHAWKFYNNYMEGAAETLHFGGGAAQKPPTDIEIRSNYFFKPQTWNPASGTYNGGVGTNCTGFPTAGCPYVVKNLLEWKNADKVLTEGNVMQNVWAGFSQSGAAILVNPKNQTSGTPPMSVCPLCQVTNITIRYNKIIDAAQAFQTANIAGDPCTGGCAGFATAGNSYSYHDDVFDDMAAPETCGALTNCSGNTVNIGLTTNTASSAPSSDILHDVTMNHMTLVVAATPATGFPNSMFSTLGPTPAAMNHLTMTNLIAPAGTFGMQPQGSGSCATGQAVTNGTAWMNACWITWTFTNNAIVNGHPSGKSWNWPSDASNFFPAAYSNVGFVNYNNGSGGDYRLCSGVGTPDPSCTGASAFHNAGSDGKDVGADVNMVNLMTTGVTTF